MMKLKNADGFTLVEVLVAIIVFGIVILSLSQVTTSYTHISKQGRFLNIANSFIEAKVEGLRNAGYNSLPTGTTNLTSSLSTQLPPSRSASMTVTQPSDGIKQVALQVSYNDQGQNHVY